MITHRMLTGKPLKGEFIYTTKSVICKRGFLAHSNKQRETPSSPSRVKEIYANLASEKDK